MSDLTNFTSRARQMAEQGRYSVDQDFMGDEVPNYGPPVQPMSQNYGIKQPMQQSSYSSPYPYNNPYSQPPGYGQQPYMPQGYPQQGFNPQAYPQGYMPQGYPQQQQQYYDPNHPVYNPGYNPAYDPSIINNQATVAKQTKPELPETKSEDLDYDTEKIIEETEIEEEIEELYLYKQPEIPKNNNEWFANIMRGLANSQYFTDLVAQGFMSITDVSDLYADNNYYYLTLFMALGCYSCTKQGLDKHNCIYCFKHYLEFLPE